MQGTHSSSVLVDVHRGVCLWHFLVHNGFLALLSTGCQFLISTLHGKVCTSSLQAICEIIIWSPKCKGECLVTSHVEPNMKVEEILFSNLKRLVCQWKKKKVQGPVTEGCDVAKVNLEIRLNGLTLLIAELKPMNSILMQQMLISRWVSGVSW